MSDSSLCVLLLEDVAVDAELVADELKRAGLSTHLRRVEDEAGFSAALDAGAPDAILADWTLPGFSGRTALAIARSRYPDVPFIFVSGTIDESSAIEALSHGAAGYVYKNQLHSLAPTLTRATDEANQRVRRRAAEQEALQANRRFSALLAAMAEGVMETDAQGAVLWGNARWVQYMGMPLEECLGRGWMRAVHPDDVEIVETTIRAATSGDSQARAFRVRYPDGAVRWLHGHGSPLLGSAGDVVGWVVSMTDISERKRAEEALEESGERLALALEAGGEAIFDWRLDTGRLALAPECYTMLGYQPGEFPSEGSAWRALIHPHDHDDYTARLRQYLKDPGELKCSLEYRARSKDGGWRRLMGRWNKVAFNAQSRLTRIVGTIVDITERYQAEQEIARLGAMYSVLSHVNQSIVHAENERELFQATCRHVVELGGLDLAWIGVADQSGSLREVAHAGRATAVLQNPLFVASTADLRGASPFARAVREETPIVSSQADLHGKCLEFGELCASADLKACMSLPLKGGTTRGVLVVHSRDEAYFDEPLQALLREVGSDVSFALENFERERQRLNANLELTRSLEDMLDVIAGTLEARDPYTAGHQRRVAKLAVATGRELGMDDARLHGLRLGGIVHDIGKIAVPGELLTKPTRLNELELGLIKMHPQAGYDLLKRIKFPWPIARVVLEHHERLDGSGYPRGIRGGETLLESQIVAVADIVEAMSSHRPYRPALGIDAALSEIMRLRGSALNADAVDACVRLFREQGYKFDDDE